MKDAIKADKKGRSVLALEDGKYTILKKSRFKKSSPVCKYHIELTERTLEEDGKKSYNFRIDVCPSLSAKPKIYLEALRSIVDDNILELSYPEENINLGKSSYNENPVISGAVEFSGKYNNKEVNGKIGAKWMISHDMVGVDVECEKEPNKEFLSAVRKALIGIKPEIDNTPEFMTLESLTKPVERLELPEQGNRRSIIRLPVEC